MEQKKKAWTPRPYLEGTQDEVKHQPQLSFDVLRNECKYNEVYPEEWNQQQHGFSQPPAERETNKQTDSGEFFSFICNLEALGGWGTLSKLASTVLSRNRITTTPIMGRYYKGFKTDSSCIVETHLRTKDIKSRG